MEYFPYITIVIIIIIVHLNDALQVEDHVEAVNRGPREEKDDAHTDQYAEDHDDDDEDEDYHDDDDDDVGAGDDEDDNDVALTMDILHPKVLSKLWQNCQNWVG